ncbi:hypothetical protein BFW38_05325 [Terasakiispira papahanaumokuakeensis]|uniref:diguanylate cyclase n=1 Tax=Terasakiispira papahanaumokuakeensis TaxID=197479 RepID=A0A1E2V811_9GAMM|nr:GGDEF domain-containing protein [Terasakiispira papahanaumokuakeensis]ODC03053.1 hypothetical protein BFW38_05325 [Terasakiispira papahanaumokuakeensis]
MKPSLWEETDQTRLTVLNAAQNFVVIAGVCFILVNLLKAQWLLAGLEIVTVIFTLVFACVTRRSSNTSLGISHRWIISWLALVFGCIAVGLSYAGAFRANQFVWVMQIPMLSYLLLGKTRGTQLTSVAASICMLTFALTNKQPSSLEYFASLANMGMALGITWALSYLYEAKREEAIQQLQEQAARDPLTGLHNRLHLESIFQQLSRYPMNKHRLVLMLIDIDWFKAINDQYGHDIGDEVLVKVAEMLQRHTRNTDWLFRVGGEEFCIILPSTPKAEACVLAEQLRKAQAQEVMTTSQGTLETTISIGLACWPTEGKKLETLYRRADQRLYQAKRSGRNQVISQEDNTSSESTSSESTAQENTLKRNTREDDNREQSKPGL